MTAAGNTDTLNTKKMLRMRAPAKINLFLHIIGRRPDGYHRLQTAFQFLDLCDELIFETGSAGSDNKSSAVQLSGDHCGIDDQQNLIVRAAVALQRATDCTESADIKIRKVLPMGAGIGGGSSDAATTLLALNQLWRTGLSLTELADIGLQLGADVPVFVHGHAAFAEGVGEQLQVIEPDQPYYLLIKPDCSVSTGNIFSHGELTRTTTPIKIAAFLTGTTRTHNDCLPVVRRLYPEIDAAMSWLGEFEKPLLTGTGACIFAAFDSEQAARSVQQKVPQEWQGYVAKGLNRSPAHEDLAAYTKLSS